MAEDKRSYKGEIDAGEILAKIEKGEDVEYDGYIIKGDISIGEPKLPVEDKKHIINSKISIKNSRIDGFVRFNNAIFKKLSISQVRYSTEKTT